VDDNLNPYLKVARIEDVEYSYDDGSYFCTLWIVGRYTEYLLFVRQWTICRKSPILADIWLN